MRPNFEKNCIFAYNSCVIGGGLAFCISDEKDLYPIEKNVFSEKIIYENFRPNFPKKSFLLIPLYCQ